MYIKINKIISLFFLLNGCMITPTVLTEQDIHRRVDHHLENLHKGQEAIQAPIDLYEAMARALKYNLEARVELMKTMLAHNKLDLSHYDLLPKLAANAGYDGRNNFSGATSRSLLSGQTSLEPSTSSDKNLFTADLSLSWDVLDFGLSYIRAQQAADDVLIAEEEKRRVANRVTQDVRIAYWRAVSSDRILGRLAHLDDWVSKALKDSQSVQERHLDSPLATLKYQRELMTTHNEIHKLHHKLSLARFELAKLINLAPGESFELALPKRQTLIPDRKLDLEVLERRALGNRSELRAIDYRQRINTRETKAAILDMLPKLNIEFGPNYNNNSFLFNNHWLTYGAKISWNLLSLFRQPAQFKMIEAQDQLLEAQSMALTMAIMTQVHVSMAQLTAAHMEVRSTKMFYDTQKEIGKHVHVSWKTKRVSEQMVIRERLNNLLAELRYDVALSELETAYANLIGAIGEDPVPITTKETTVIELANKLRTRWDMLVQADNTMRTSEQDS